MLSFLGKFGLNGLTAAVLVFIVHCFLTQASSWEVAAGCNLLIFSSTHPPSFGWAFFLLVDVFQITGTLLQQFM